MPLADFIATDRGLGAGLDALVRHGFVVLRARQGDPEPGRALAEEVAGRIGYLRRTIFGSLWDLAPGLTDHADTSYNREELAPHTDGTYSHDAPGLQFFVCATPASDGGESLLVDGFAAAVELASAAPEDAATLATIDVVGQYLEPGVHLRAERPALRVDGRGVLRQVSFNNYDRAAFLLPAGLENRFYRAYSHLAALINDRRRWATVKLERGDALIFDNWRLLHGRAAFVGSRHYVGGYLNHEDLESRCRVAAAGGFGSGRQEN